MPNSKASTLTRGAGNTTRNVYPVTVDYDQTLDQMIEAGKYDHNDNITAENFPIEEGTVEIEVVLVHFNHDISSENAIKEMEQMGLEPAKREHLLAYSAQHWQCDPELIVALGSSQVITNGNRNVPCLIGCYGDREFKWLSFDGDWLDSWRFLAVRKS